MQKHKIELLNGYAEIPADMRVIDISADGNINHVAIIADHKHEVPPIAVVSDKTMCGLSTDTEKAVVEAAIKDLPEYQTAWKDVNGTGIIRLGLFPLEMIRTMAKLGKCEYRLVRKVAE